MTDRLRGSGSTRIARRRHDKQREPAAAAREHPPVFHVFEELYARTLRETRAGPGAVVISGADR